MKKTVDDIMRARPCDPYTRERIWELVGDEGVTAEEMAKLDIPGRDILWALIYVWMDEAQCLEFATKTCLGNCKVRASQCPQSTRVKDAVKEAEKAVLNAERALAAKDKDLAHKSAMKAVAAELDSAWVALEITVMLELLTSALITIGEGGNNDEKDCG